MVPVIPVLVAIDAAAAGSLQPASACRVHSQQPQSPPQRLRVGPNHRSRLVSRRFHRPRRVLACPPLHVRSFEEVRSLVAALTASDSIFHRFWTLWLGGETTATRLYFVVLLGISTLDSTPNGALTRALLSLAWAKNRRLVFRTVSGYVARPRP